MLFWSLPIAGSMISFSSILPQVMYCIINHHPLCGTQKVSYSNLCAMSLKWSWIAEVRDLGLSLQYFSPEHNNVPFQRDDLNSPNFKNGWRSEVTQNWGPEVTPKTGGGIWQSFGRTRPRSAFEGRHIFVSWNHILCCMWSCYLKRRRQQKESPKYDAYFGSSLSLDVLM